MNQVEQIKEEIVQKDKSRFLTFLLFVVISTALWFLIKLTKDYSTQTVFLVRYTEVPVNKWVSTPEQQVKLTFVGDGFVTLGHNLVRNHRRVVEISLSEVPYRLEGGFTYSYSSQYVAEKVADWLNIPTGNVTINDDKQYFNMEDLQSKELPVTVLMSVKTQRQYGVYGDPKVDPPTVTVFGPKNLLDTLNYVTTEWLRAENVSEDVHRTLKVDLYEGAIRSAVESVEVSVDVEKFTEMDVEVPVTIHDSLSVRFFPETMKVKCMVAIRDFASVTPSSFQVLADTAQLHRREPLLDIGLFNVPEHVQVLKSEPKQVEYLIIN
ncbi:MAG: YbbR-like domain-containing protein [Bacteroidales bacterium]|nr:YbbR-like domain-containing protein [Bacteroidales bacterium]